MRSRPVLALGVLTAALATPAVAGAYAPLTFEQPLVADLVADIAVAAGPQRQVAVLAQAQNNGPATLYAVQRPSGGPAGPVQPLDAEPNVSFLNLAALPSGAMLAVWSHNTNGQAGSSAIAEPGRLFGSLRAFTTPEARHSLAVDRNGRAVVAFNGLAGGANRTVRTAVNNPLQPTLFATSQNLTTAQATTFTPVVAASPDGQAVVAWSRPEGGGAVIEAATGSVIGMGFTIPMSPVDTLADPADPADVTAAAGGASVKAVAWTDRGGTDRVRAAFSVPGAGPVAGPVTVSGGGTAGSPAIVVGSDGTTTIAWVEDGSVRVATRPAGGPVGPATTVSATGVEQGLRRSPDLVADPNGNLFLSWLRTTGGTTVLESARRPAGGTFGPPATIAAGVATFATAAEPGGNLAAVWTVPADGVDDALRIGGLDGDRPAVEATVPPTAGAGVPQSLSATASDWGGIAAYTWDMGDGTTLAGATVSHVYSAPGPRVVTLRVTDRAGNVTTVTRTVTVIGTALADLDRRPPRVTQFRVTKAIPRSALVRRGLGIRLRTDEAARVTVELLGRARVATLQARGDVVLAQRAARLVAGRARAFVLKPPARLVSGTRGFRATVRITLTDAAGNRATVTRAVRVRRA
ncbi:MAG: PKD domain-containing protein [Thermoleophilia bacterium]